MTFKAYVDNIQAKSGKTPEAFWKLANKKGFVKHGKVVATHADLLAWISSGIGPLLRIWLLISDFLQRADRC